MVSRDCMGFRSGLGGGGGSFPGGDNMKQHRFWAWGAVICMVMALITGYRHK